MFPPRSLVPPGQKPTNLTPYYPKRMGVLKLYCIEIFKDIRTDLLLLDASNIPFHTHTTHLSLKTFIHVPRPSPLLALGPNAS
jgi:hypothetical protein